MASLFKSLEDQLVGVLERGYGTSHTIESGKFRRSADRMPLLDPNYPGQRFDLAYELQYLAVADHTGDRVTNPCDPAFLLDVTLALRLGVLQGAGAAPGWNPSAAGSGETAAFAVLNARRRALEWSQRVWRALNWPDNVRTSDTDPRIVDVRRVGDVALDDLGNGRLIATTTLRATLQCDPANDYPPDE